MINEELNLYKNVYVYILWHQLGQIFFYILLPDLYYLKGTGDDYDKMSNTVPDK